MRMGLGSIAGGARPATFAYFLRTFLELLDELLQRRRVIGVKQQRQAIEQADALGINSQLLQSLIELLQLLLGALRRACGIAIAGVRPVR